MALTKPEWLTIKPASTEKYKEVKETVALAGLHTVCTEARCPNMSECWDNRTATFMVMGELCTRGCRFCSVSKSARGAQLDREEPRKLAEAIRKWGLSYVVVTSVCRDDLEDQGAGHFAECVREIKTLNQNTLIELLIPDFRADDTCLKTILEAEPNVVGHNIETVRRISPTIRDGRASYEQSLLVLRRLKELRPAVLTKSAMMLGLEETDDEITEAMRDLVRNKVDFLALGQYLRPSNRQLPVREYLPPERFEGLRRRALGMGFKYVAAGPFVRSSYRAGEYFIENSIARTNR